MAAVALHTTPLWDRAIGKWRSLLTLLGVPQEALSGRHAPCPICKAGRDRFRFVDRDGNGTWFCNQCGHGTGTDLVKLMFGVDFKGAADMIEPLLPSATAQMPKAKDEKSQRRRMLEVWRGTFPIEEATPAWEYLMYRGINPTSHMRNVLRWHPSLPVSRDDPRRFPCMIGKVQDRSGVAVNVHRTFLTREGRKAPIEKNKLCMSGALPIGSAIRLMEPTEALVIAEGIETALSASVLFSAPCWSLISANGMAGFFPPAGLSKLVIAGDNDASFHGQWAAYAAARNAWREGVETRVEIHPVVGSDWNDTANQ